MKMHKYLSITMIIVALTMVGACMPEPDQGRDDAHTVQVAPGIFVGEPTGSDSYERNTLVVGDVSWLLDGIAVPEDSPLTMEQIKEDNQRIVALGIEEMLDTDYFFENKKMVKKFSHAYVVGKTIIPQHKMVEDTEGIPVIVNQSPSDPARPTKTGAYYDQLSIRLDEIKVIHHEGEKYMGYSYIIEGERPILAKRKGNKQYNEYLKMKIAIMPRNDDRTRVAGYSFEFDNALVAVGDPKPNLVLDSERSQITLTNKLTK